jgi:hypothetical protein
MFVVESGESWPKGRAIAERHPAWDLSNPKWVRTADSEWGEAGGGPGTELCGSVSVLD